MKKQAELGLNLSTRRTRKAAFLDEMALVVPWRELVALMAAASPVASAVCPPLAHEIMLRTHFLQRWFERNGHPDYISRNLSAQLASLRWF